MSTTTTEEIDIPDNVFVPCPIDGRWDNVRVATTCIACIHSRGLFGKKLQGDPKLIEMIPFIKRFDVNCGYPVQRQMLEVVL